ncbi:LamG-like jellyroll fold domain-containing protein [Nocardioides sp. Arc9.136]|uniref:LamG-like jellyroll fold domain-containing protein n=1 Tax=Nocardioides sp. Arc9.136 TaxID=2996826 RepID=UPI0026667D17|nr:LamG-like jellyroll fold domain-containing protein [Nocardioides sp. Arc9.136]WKN50235.1 LamG domain-containing protein [Nocardioides sp. Arc9.136]
MAGALAAGALVLPGATGPGAGAGAGAAVAATTSTTTVLQLGFDGADTFASGTPVLDDTGAARGRVVSNRGALTPTSGSPGRAVQYPCPTCGRALIEVPDAAALDPGTAAFSIGVDVRMTREESRRSMNVAQKGYYGEPGGQYKLQVDQGRPSCVVSGARTRLVAVASGAEADVADGAWHRVVCSRTATEVLVLVDGVVRARATGVVGSVANASPLRIGAKNVSATDNDQFRADLDDVVVQVG